MFVKSSIVVGLGRYCSSVIIDENQLSSAHNIWGQPNIKRITTKSTPPQQYTKTAIVIS